VSGGNGFTQSNGGSTEDQQRKGESFFSVRLRIFVALCEIRSVPSVASVTVLSVAFVTVLSAISVASRPQTPPSPPPNVLLITIDTVRADRLGAYGYQKASTPVLDRLAREGVRFANATTQAPLTGPAHAALLTGVYPARLGVRDNATTPIPDSATTAAEAFKAKGYRTGGFVGAFVVTAPYGFAQGFETFDADFPGFTDAQKLQVQRRGGAVVDAALKWLDVKDTRPFFGWLHLYDAHAPYDAPAPFGARFTQSPYDGEIAYVDACIGRVIAALEQSGRLDRTIVAVVADHGESLGEHGEAEHGMFLYEGVLRIPWIMRLPGHAHAGATLDEQVRAIDVLPTIAQLAGISVSGVDGESVVPMINGDARKNVPASYAETYYPKWHYGWSELRSLRDGRWKYIDAPRREVFDLTNDAGEQRNLVDARGPLAAGMSAALERIAGRFGAAATTTAPQPDADTLARLRSLGYIGMAAPARPGARGPDPKDMIAGAEAFRVAISRAMDALGRNDGAAAILQLKRLLDTYPRSYELHLFLGDAYAATRQFDNALGEYAAAALVNPSAAAPALSAARAYLTQGDTTRALQKADEAGRIERDWRRRHCRRPRHDPRARRSNLRRDDCLRSGGAREPVRSTGAREARQPGDANQTVRRGAAAVRGAARDGLSPVADAFRPRPDRRGESRREARCGGVSGVRAPGADVRRREGRARATRRGATRITAACSAVYGFRDGEDQVTRDKPRVTQK
jgi:choline-sulfatase